MDDAERWRAIDAFFADRLAYSDVVLDAALRASGDAGLPAIQVAPNQGRLLQLLALAIGAERVLEVGTLAGYSTIWLARALPPGGCLVTLEIEPRHAEIARANIARAGLDRVVEIRVGPALDTLARIEAERPPPFDLVFIDADKPSNPAYFDHALKLVRPGGLIVVDNVVREGRVIDPAVRDDPVVRGVHELCERIAAEPRVAATVLQTVGDKGHDGLLIARVQR
jgi:predicted O-methyltransferase YrrM